MCKVIAIANSKGGTAKTTSSSSLAIGLAKKGKKVLLIDTDSQGNLSQSLDINEPDDLDISFATIMGMVVNDEDIPEGYGIIHHEEGVELLPGNIETSALESTLVNVMSRETVLRRYIDTIKDKYDYVILDCAPHLGMITINAFTCADSIIIPCQASHLSVKGLEQLIKIIFKVKRQLNPKLMIEGILITMVDNRTKYAKETIEKLTDVYGKNIRIFKEKIPMSVRAAEISAEGVSIYKHDPKGNVAKAYQSLVEEVLSNDK